MNKISVPIPGHTYNILIKNGLLKTAGSLLKNVINPKAVLFIVTDENVAPLYLDTLVKSLQEVGYKVHATILPAGESTKCIGCLEHLYNAFTEHGVTRSDAVIALGGGVIGDIAGFAASTILRGIDFIQIPTTLLAQVDSSVGGKVAIDLKAGKNLVGAFYQPKIVLIDPSVLNTLNDLEFSSGMAEVIKYGCIKDPELFETIENANGRLGIMKNINTILEICCSIKAAVVTEDEYDTGIRKILNFGHTLGHAYELAYNYEKYNHGQAISAGMVIASRLGLMTGITKDECVQRIIHVLNQFQLPTSIPCSLSNYQKAIEIDKKSEGSFISLIFITKIGESIIKKIPKETLMKLLKIIESEKSA